MEVFHTMSKQKTLEPWRTALNDLRATKKMSYSQIGDILNMPETTISRLFTGEAKKPDFFFVAQVIRAMGGSVSEILGEGGAYIVSQDVVTLQTQYDELKANYDRLLEEHEVLKTKNIELTDELLEVVNYFVRQNKEGCK
jgi:transcriptional regulator with XRE-family HTH domain